MAKIADLFVAIGADAGGLIRGFDSATSATEKWAKDFKKQAADYAAVGRGLFETGSRLSSGMAQFGTAVNDVTTVVSKLGNVSDLSGKELLAFGGAVAQASGSVLMLAGSLPGLINGLGALSSSAALLGPGFAAVGAGLVGWGIGTAIRDVTGLGAVIDNLIPSNRRLAESDAKIHEENQRLHEGLERTRAALRANADENDRLAAAQRERVAAEKAAKEEAKEEADHLHSLIEAYGEFDKTMIQASSQYQTELAAMKASVKSFIEAGDLNSAGIAAKDFFSKWDKDGVLALQHAGAAVTEVKGELQSAKTEAQKAGDELTNAFKRVAQEAAKKDPLSELSQGITEAATLMQTDMEAFGEVTDETKQRISELADELGMLPVNLLGEAADKMRELRDATDSAKGKGKGGGAGGSATAKDEVEKTAAELNKLAQSTQRVDDQNNALAKTNDEWRKGVQDSTAAVEKQTFTSEQAISGWTDAIQMMSHDMTLTGESVRALAPDVQNLSQMMRDLNDSGHAAMGALDIISGAGMMALGQVNESNLRFAQAMQTLAADVSITDSWMRQLTAGLQQATDATKPVDVFAKATQDAAAAATGMAKALDVVTGKTETEAKDIKGQSASLTATGSGTLGGRTLLEGKRSGGLSGLLGSQAGGIGSSSSGTGGSSGFSGQGLGGRPIVINLHLSNGTVKQAYADMLDEDRQANIQTRV